MPRLTVLFGTLISVACMSRPAAGQSVDINNLTNFAEVTKNTYYLIYSSFGSEEIGPSIGALAVSLPGLVAPGSQFDAAVVLAGPSIDDRLEAVAIGLKYRQKLPFDGLSYYIEADAADIRLGGAQSVAAQATGWQGRLAAGIRREARLTPNSRLTTALEFEHRAAAGEVFGTSILDERLSIVHGRLLYSTTTAASTHQVELEISKGLDAFGSTGGANPLASRPGAGAAFLKASVTASVTVPLTGAVSLRNSAYAQWADRALPFSQRCGYGSNRFSRGFDTSFIGGDLCLALSHEIAFNAPAGRFGDLGLIFLQPYVSLDHGVSRDRSSSPAVSPAGRWASISAGVRWGTTNLIAEASVSRILERPSGGPPQPATRAWLRAALRF